MFNPKIVLVSTILAASGAAPAVAQVKDLLNPPGAPTGDLLGRYDRVGGGGGRPARTPKPLPKELEELFGRIPDKITVLPYRPDRIERGVQWPRPARPRPLRRGVEGVFESLPRGPIDVLPRYPFEPGSGPSHHPRRR